MKSILKSENNIDKLSIKYLVLFLCFFFFTINFWILYPGGFTADTVGQYNQALGIDAFSSHHPPFMAFWWRCMMKIWNNPSTMLLCHLGLLWGAVYNFYRSLDFLNNKFKFLYLIIPFLPWILTYSVAIWKDVSFAYSYLFVASLLCYLTALKQRPTTLQISTIFIVLFYGTAVKYQARFILPIMSVWIATVIVKDKQIKKIVIASTIIFCSVFFAQEAITNYLINNKQGNSQSWQMVKLYDLAAISFYQDKLLFPQYILDNPNLNLEILKKSYNHGNVNSFIYNKDILLNITQDQNQLNDLWNFWFKNILKYPKSYLKHRLLLLYYTLNAQHYYVLEYYIKDAPEGYKNLRDITIFTLDYVKDFKESNKMKYWVIFIPLYILLGFFVNRKIKNGTGNVLIFMNLCGLFLMLVLIPFSMASDSRYLLLTSAMVTFSHPIAFTSLWNLLKIRKDNILKW